MSTIATSTHETARRLRVLTRHLDRHPHLPPVTSLGTDYVADVAVTVAGEAGTAGFLAWAATIEAPRVQTYPPDTSGAAMLRCTGRLGADVVRVSSHIEDLPAGCVRDEPIPLIGLRHLLAHTGWTAQPATNNTENEVQQ